MMRIDAHQHYWQIARHGHAWPTADLPEIHRDFGPRDLAPLIAAAEIERTVLVQSQPDATDTEWLLQLADDTPSIGAVVGWVDMVAPDAPAQIAALADRAKLRGLRPMLQDLPDDWILDAAAAPALATSAARGIVLDALIRPRHLRSINVLARRHEDLSIVVDHGAKPQVADQLREPWASDIALLAQRPNVSCKLSGLATEAGSDWKADDLRFYVDHLVACFGPERLIWGSDWPVVLLAGDYGRWLSTAEELIAHLPERERAAIFGGNAQRVYRIA